jgi:uncharacterized protein with ParB-like and HNH nuclease domain
MADAFDSHPQNFGTLLGKFTQPVIVPPFQRGYSWEKSHVSTFCDDILGFKQDAKVGEQYFLGPIVIITENTETHVLDGQQRLATATIFFSVLRDIARTFGTTQGNDFARDVQRDLIEKEDEFSLQLGETDELYFRKTIQSDPPQNEKAVLRSHGLIKTAREYIKSVVLK